jgi:hypothetical protein
VIRLVYGNFVNNLVCHGEDFMKKNLPRSRKSGLVCQTTGSETLVYDLKNDTAHCLNSTSTTIWSLCDGEKTATEIVALFQEKTGQVVSEEMIDLACEQLAERHLLTSGGLIEGNTVSRRSLIQKVALSTAVVLPIIATIAAPTSLSAQSLLPDGSPCQNGPQCASGNCVGIGGGAKTCRT